MADEPIQRDESLSDPKKPKGLLYHYTSQDGFLGILDSDSLRATHIKYMNDSNEFIDALEHLGGLIDEFDETLRPILKKFMESTLAGFSQAYVISFTDDEEQLITTDQMPGDRLSQWRAYSGGGRGVSLGLDYQHLDRRISGSAWTTPWNTEGTKAFLLNCKYRNNDKRKIFQQMGSELADDLKKIVAEIASSGLAQYPDLQGKQEWSESWEPRITSVFQQLIYPFLFSAASFKNPAYFEEKEWRVVILLSSPGFLEGSSGTLAVPVKFRSGLIGITPYIEPPLGLRTRHSPLRRIVVGPTPHIREAVKGVEMALEDKGIRLKSKDFPNGVEVVPSQIPYRNW